MKVVVIAICLTGISANNMLAQVGVAKTAKTIKIGESQKIRLSKDEFSDFKIVTTEDGSLTISLESYAECTFFALYNEDGISFNSTKQEIVTSGNRYCEVPYTYTSGGYVSAAREIVRFNLGDKIVSCIWNPTVEKFKGSVTFKLDAGTYYLRIIRGETGLSSANLSISLQDLDGNEVNTEN